MAYHRRMTLFLTYLLSLATLTLGVGLLHLIPRLGKAGRQLSEHLRKGLPLDLVIFGLTLGPWVAAVAIGVLRYDGVGGVLLCLVVAVAAQITALVGWCRLHELRHRKLLGGPRITKSLGRIIGPVRNTAALYWMLWAVPMFNGLRLVEYVVYPVLVKLTKLPKYDDREWVTVSRQKFDGLVGADRIWCLYCDWMTGIWSLGSEMLRNIESLWCPIRFGDPRKCENCKVDFPDVDGQWVPADASVADAAALLDERYPASDGSNAWLGHPVRLTVQGQDSPANP